MNLYKHSTIPSKVQGSAGGLFFLYRDVCVCRPGGRFDSAGGLFSCTETVPARASAHSRPPFRVCGKHSRRALSADRRLRAHRADRAESIPAARCQGGAGTPQRPLIRRRRRRKNPAASRAGRHPVRSTGRRASAGTVPDLPAAEENAAADKPICTVRPLFPAKSAFQYKNLGKKWEKCLLYLIKCAFSVDFFERCVKMKMILFPG